MYFLFRESPLEIGLAYDLAIWGIPVGGSPFREGASATPWGSEIRSLLRRGHELDRILQMKLPKVLHLDFYWRVLGIQGARRSYWIHLLSLLGACLTKEERKITVPFCDYFTHRNECFGIFGMEGKRLFGLGDRMEPPYKNRP